MSNPSSDMTTRAPRFQSHSWLTALQRYVFARTLLEAKLYPPLTREVLFRVYRPDDFGACLTIYRKNEPGRFPESQRSKFEEYLANEEKTLIVAECDSMVVGYGGINLLGQSAATLCYGILEPEFQKQRIGSTLTLLRIALLPTRRCGAFVLIFAVDASMRIYQRFGFVEKGLWKAEDGKDYPIGFLHVPVDSLGRVKSTLAKRRLRIQGEVVLRSTENLSCEVKEGPPGHFRIQVQPRVEPPPPPKIDHKEP